MKIKLVDGMVKGWGWGVEMTEQLRIVSRQFVTKNLSLSSYVCWVFQTKF